MRVICAGMARSDRRRRASNLARLRHVDRAPEQAISEEDRIAGNPTEPVIIPPVFRTASRLAAISSLVLYCTSSQRHGPTSPVNLLPEPGRGSLRCMYAGACHPPAGPRRGVVLGIDCPFTVTDLTPLRASATRAL